MLTPTELKAFECIFTGRKREGDLPKGGLLPIVDAIKQVRLYMEIRRLLLGGEVNRIVASDDRYELHVNGKGLVATTGFVWGYSGQRPGRPVINFTFSSVGQNSADVCFHNGFTVNLLFARQKENMDCQVPKGWLPWTEPPNKPPTRKWAVVHGICTDLEHRPELAAGIAVWHRHWKIQ